MITVKELARKWNLIPETVRKYARNGLPYEFNEKGRMVFDEGESDQWYVNYKTPKKIEGKVVNGNGIVKLPEEQAYLYRMHEEKTKHQEMTRRDVRAYYLNVSPRKLRKIRYALNTSPLPLHTLVVTKYGTKYAETTEEYLAYCKRLEHQIKMIATELAMTKRRMRLNEQSRLTWTDDEESIVTTVGVK